MLHIILFYDNFCRDYRGLLLLSEILKTKGHKVWLHALWNNAMGIGNEMSAAFKAKAEKKDPEFEDMLPRRKYLEGEIPS